MVSKDIIQEQLNIIQSQLAREKLLRKVSQFVSRSLDLDIDVILESICQETRKFMKADRVGIYKFEEGSDCSVGSFVTESKSEELDSIIGHKVIDNCFKERYLSHDFQGKYFAINDVNDTHLPSCHIDVLLHFQIKANLVIPIFNRNTLWGLLCVQQCFSARKWQDTEIDVLQQLANYLVIIIEKATLFEQLKTEVKQLKQAEAIINKQARRERLSREISQRISQHLELTTIFDTACAEIREFLQADRVCIFRFDPEANYDDGVFVSESVGEEIDSVLAKRVHDHSFGQHYATHYFEGKYLALDDIYAENTPQCHIDILEQFQIRANLVFPLSLRARLWGLLCVHQCQNARKWEEADLDLAQQLSTGLAIAIQQAELFERLQTELDQRQAAQQELSQRNEELAITNLELERATRLKDEFLANMSHELRTPLNTILGMMQALGEGIFGHLNDAQLKSIQTTERNGRHLLELINEILDLAKVESGTLELDCQATNVTNLCQFSLSVVAQQALEKAITLDSKLPYTIPEPIIDERRIKQVLINLLNNAIKFTPSGGYVSLEVKYCPINSNVESQFSTQNSIQFIVSDTGIGIEKNNLNKLFKPFVQIDSSLNRQYAGTGLGLALVKRIVELHHGFVTVRSKVGEGSTFTVELPCTEKSSKKAESDISISHDLDNKSSTANLVKLRVLVVEDNPDNVLLIRSYLVAKGYQVVVAENGVKGIEAALAELPDMILMDIQMPEMDGFDAISKIREYPQLAEIPIIALTALAMKGDREKCLAAGANEYLGKPINLKQLTEKISALCAQNYK